ncbi:ABC transporter substrate-binding protein [Cytobacillus sp. FJAT-54145]|uniref:ABC transporter substrate-binding protein n=1 Tax=Cytobacillus spartinae TaxID=3299023 RepID=A0ABW6K925_9BACI
MYKSEDLSVSSIAGTIHVVDPSPLNWLYVLFNTMEEAVRADHKGRIIPSLGTHFEWVDDSIFEVTLRKGVFYHNNEPFNAQNVLQNFTELEKWIAPHPPGTWVNFPDGTILEVVDDYKLRYHFPKPHGLAIGQMRGNHYANQLFWKQLGFGYAKLGTAEGHW